MKERDILKRFEFYTKFHVKEIYSLVSILKDTKYSDVGRIIENLCVDSVYTKNNIIYYRGYKNGIFNNSKKYYSIDNIIDKVNRHVKFFTTYKNIEVLVNAGKSLKYTNIFLDIDKYVECICILISNSVRHSRSNSTIKIYIRELDSELVTTVVDFGTGIDIHVKDNLFKDIITEGSSGVGLGLLVLRYHTNSMSGVDLDTLERCEGDSNGDSTKFSFKIPLVSTISEGSSTFVEKEIILLYISKNYISDKLIRILSNIGFVPIRIFTRDELRILLKGMEFKTIICSKKDITFVKKWASKPIICVTKKNYLAGENVTTLTEPIVSSDLKEILDKNF